MSQQYNELIDKYKRIKLFETTLSIIGWDRDCYMPQNGYKYRSEQIELLSSLIHKEFISTEFEEALQKAEQNTKIKDKESIEAINLKYIRKSFDQSKKIPLELVGRIAKQTTIANHKWMEARKEKDFTIFAPHLKIVSDLCREQAYALDFEDSPYQALVDIYEPEMKISQLNSIFSYLKNELIILVNKIKDSSVKIDQSYLLNGDYDEAQQAELGIKVISAMGFDFDSGRVDITTHPFCTELGPDDIRIATKYHRKDLLSALYATIHEAGHGLYDQGLVKEYFGTPAGEYVSTGVHESQSLFWEKLLGKSKGFIEHFLPELKRLFPTQFSNIDVDALYKAANYSSPSFIRIEADEVTYNLHIIIRFEIEQMIIDQGLNINDVPYVWNLKYKEYLGITPPDDVMGCMQDVHWGLGLFGYFPSYTLGYLYAAQFYNKAVKDIGDLDEHFLHGNFSIILDWLRKNIHVHGKKYNSRELVKKVTDSDLTAKDFITYLNNKFGKIYNL